MPKALTEQRLMNMALFYLSQYETSEQKMRQMLNRRVRRLKMQGEDIPAETPEWIEHVLKRIRDNAYIDDKRYAENQIRALVQQGKSESFMCAKLALAGIKPEQVRDILRCMESNEETRAKRFVERKRIGPFRPTADRSRFWEKDMASLARAGFSYDIARQALKSDDSE
ncbi:MAG: regulatory protein RecX [Pseudomonadota bacterium]|nr:regulatory protein RecX [Pseudomonadota bacterium]